MAHRVPETADLVHQENFVSEKVIHATDADFDSTVLQSSEPVLVDFWAEWCGPCKMIAPALDELAEAYDGKVRIAKVNVDENRGTAMKYHVRSIPLLLLFKDGQVQATQIGAVGKPQLAQRNEQPLRTAPCADVGPPLDRPHTPTCDRQ